MDIAAPVCVAVGVGKDIVMASVPIVPIVAAGKFVALMPPINKIRLSPTAFSVVTFVLPPAFLISMPGPPAPSVIIDVAFPLPSSPLP
jgi:hypothetical protein